jgi:hypothetical protein
VDRQLLVGVIVGAVVPLDDGAGVGVPDGGAVVGASVAIEIELTTTASSVVRPALAAAVSRLLAKSPELTLAVSAVEIAEIWSEDVSVLLGSTDMVIEKPSSTTSVAPRPRRAPRSEGASRRRSSVSVHVWSPMSVVSTSERLAAIALFIAASSSVPYSEHSKPLIDIVESTRTIGVDVGAGVGVDVGAGIVPMSSPSATITDDPSRSLAATATPMPMPAPTIKIAPTANRIYFIVGAGVVVFSIGFGGKV